MATGSVAHTILMVAVEVGLRNRRTLLAVAVAVAVAVVAVAVAAVVVVADCHDSDIAAADSADVGESLVTVLPYELAREPGQLLFDWSEFHLAANPSELFEELQCQIHCSMC